MILGSKLKKLRQKRQGGNADWGGAGEGIAFDKSQVEGNLKGMFRSRNALEVFKIRVEVPPAG